MDADTTLTLDQALDIEIADEGEGNLVPAQPPMADEPGGDTFEPDSIPEPAYGLTLEQAAEIYDDGENDQSSSLKLAPSSAAAIIDGKPVTLSDLVRGYAGFQRVQQALGRLDEEYEAVQQAADGVVSSAWELSRFMVAQMPPEPDMVLLQLNPTEYVQQKAQHDQALGSVQHVLGQAQQARASAFSLQERYHNLNLETEKTRLEHHFPELSDSGHRHQFFQRMLDVAYACGFSRAEFEQVVDHRIFRLGALALKGMEAIAEAPKPREKRRHRRRRYSEAMERLERTGSIEDAVMVDFD